MLKLFRFSVVCFVCLSFSSAGAALSPEALGYLEKIPGGKLNLQFVVAQALENAEAYKQLGLQYHQADLQYEMALIMEEWNLSASGLVTDNEFEVTSPFQPVRTQGWNWNLGLNKRFSTGTSLTLAWDHRLSDLQYNLPPGLGNGFVTDFRQTVATVLLEQSLLKDFFGYSHGKKLSSAKNKVRAIKTQAKFEMERTTLAFIDAFYQAWLQQQRVLSVSEQVRRRQRLMKVTKRKRERGVVEAPEYIQIEALLAATESDRAVAKSDLRATWEKLVLNLKLPVSFLQIDPIEVPTVLDNPMAKSLRLCYQKAPEMNKEIEALEMNVSALTEALDASINEGLPDLKLRAQYQGNGIDGRSRETFEDIWQGSGPSWEVGLVLNWPLGNLANKVDRKNTYIEKMKLESQLQLAKDSLKTSWLETCRRLQVENNNETRFKKIVRKQKQRVRAEEKRFSLGRITVDQLVTAEDDLGAWEFRYQQQAVTTRQIAWQVQNLSGDLYNQLSKAIEGRLQQ